MSADTPIRSKGPQPPRAPALHQSSTSLPRHGSNKSLPGLSSRPHTPQEALTRHYSPSSGHSGPTFTTPSPQFKIIPSGRSSPRPILRNHPSNSSMRSGPSICPSVSVSSVNTDQPPRSSSRAWSRHCPSPSAPPSPSLWATSASQPSPMMVKTKTGPSSPRSQRPEVPRSASDSWAPTGMNRMSQFGDIGMSPAPRLQRKKSSASLLVNGIGRSLSRVGSVMRRNNNSHDSGAAGSGAHASPGSIPRNRAVRQASSGRLQDLFEEESDRSDSRQSERQHEAPRTSKESRGRSSRDAMPPGWTRVTLQKEAQGPAVAAAAVQGSDSGVSLPFNVQHDLHVNADLEGLPEQWIEQLKANGLSEADLLLITAAQRRHRAVSRIEIKPRGMEPIVDAVQDANSERAVKPATPVAPEAKPAQDAARIVRPVEEDKVGPVNATLTKRPSQSHLAGKTSSSKKLQAMQRRLSRFNVSEMSLSIPPVTPSNTAPPTPIPKTPIPATPVARPQTSPHTPGASGVYRKPSIISKLLNDLDSVSAHPSRSKGGTLQPPPRTDGSDSEAESVQSARPSLRTRRGRSRSRRTSNASSAGRTESKRLSEELRGFRNIALDGEDGWASSVLAAWDGDSMIRTRTASPGPERVSVQRVPEKVHIEEHEQEPVSAGFGLAHTPPTKPRSLHSLRRSPSPAPPPALSPGMRRRSRSFDFDHSVRAATLYSPPPPPPNPHKEAAKYRAWRTPPVAPRSVVRESVDSFGVHRRDSSSSGSRSPSGSEMDVGTPPLDSDGPSASQAKPVMAKPHTLTVIPRRHDSVPTDAPSTAHETQDDGIPNTPASLTAAYLTNSVQTGTPSRRRSAHFSFPTSAVSHSQSPSINTRPQSLVDDDVAYHFASNIPPVSVLGLCLNLDESTPSHTQTTKGQGQGHGHSLSASSFTENRMSTLSRMSSIASSVHSYSVHEATVQRAYTRVLRRVNEVVREGTETPMENTASSKGSHSDTDGAMGALEEAAWRVALRGRR